MRCSPSTAAFLKRLPDGLDSYPECVVKISVVRTWMEDHDPQLIADELPESIDAETILAKPVTAWLPEVHATVLYLTLRDACFDSDDAYVAAAYRKNVRLLRSPLYRVLGSLFSLGRISSAGALVFKRMHRGIEPIADSSNPKRLFWTLEYPPNLVPPLIARCYSTALKAAIERGGLRGATIEIEDYGPTRLRFVITPP